MVALSMTGCHPDSKFTAAMLKPLYPWLTASVSPSAIQIVRTEDNIPLHAAFLGVGGRLWVLSLGSKRPCLPLRTAVWYQGTHSCHGWRQAAQTLCLSRGVESSAFLARSLCHQEHRKRQGHCGPEKPHGNVDLKVVHKIQVR